MIGIRIGRISQNTNIAIPILVISGSTGLVLDAAGGALTNVRAGTANVTTNDGVKVAKANEIRYQGGRRIENLATANSIAIGANITISPGAGDYIFSMGQGSFSGVATFSGTAGATGTLTQDAVARTAKLFTLGSGTFIITGSAQTLTNILIEKVSGQANKNPSSDVDFNTLYNAGLVGIAYKNTTNGNTLI